MLTKKNTGALTNGETADRLVRDIRRIEGFRYQLTGDIAHLSIRGEYLDSCWTRT